MHEDSAITIKTKYLKETNITANTYRNCHPALMEGEALIIINLKFKVALVL